MTGSKYWHYFKNEEFECPCCGIEKMEPLFVLKLDQARGLAGVPFKINSGWRCEAYNKRLKRSVKTSAHLHGLAADIKAVNSRQRSAILQALYGVGFTRVGVSKGFIHVDLDESKPQNVLWLY